VQAGVFGCREGIATVRAVLAAAPQQRGGQFICHFVSVSAVPQARLVWWFAEPTATSKGDSHHSEAMNAPETALTTLMLMGGTFYALPTILPIVQQSMSLSDTQTASVAAVEFAALCILPLYHRFAALPHGRYMTVVLLGMLAVGARLVLAQDTPLTYSHLLVAHAMAAIQQALSYTVAVDLGHLHGVRVDSRFLVPLGVAAVLWPWLVHGPLNGDLANFHRFNAALALLSCTTMMWLLWTAPAEVRPGALLKPEPAHRREVDWTYWVELLVFAATSGVAIALSMNAGFDFRRVTLWGVGQLFGRLTPALTPLGPKARQILLACAVGLALLCAVGVSHEAAVVALGFVEGLLWNVVVEVGMTQRGLTRPDDLAAILVASITPAQVSLNLLAGHSALFGQVCTVVSSVGVALAASLVMLDDSTDRTKRA
jgi:hypothetical protein